MKREGRAEPYMWQHKPCYEKQHQAQHRQAEAARRSGTDSPDVGKRRHKVKLPFEGNSPGRPQERSGLSSSQISGTAP